MTVPASFRPPRPDSCRPALARDGHAPMPLATAPVAAPHGPVATLYASDHVGAAPATACGKEHNDADPFGADDILAIAQGVANTQADLEILRNGVTDITESSPWRIGSVICGILWRLRLRASAIINSSFVIRPTIDG